MKYNIQKSIEILERTPVVLKTLLSGLSDDWTMNNEGLSFENFPNVVKAA